MNWLRPQLIHNNTKLYADSVDNREKIANECRVFGAKLKNKTKNKMKNKKRNDSFLNE